MNGDNVFLLCCFLGEARGGSFAKVQTCIFAQYFCLSDVMIGTSAGEL